MAPPVLTLGSGLSAARTGAFVTLTAAQLVHAFECMSEERSLFGIRLSENPFMLISVILSFVCMLACIYVPVLAGVFSLVPLSAGEWLISLSPALILPVGAAIVNGQKD